MANNIYIKTGDISCIIIRDSMKALEEAQKKILAARGAAEATYNGPEGHCERLFPASINNEIVNLSVEVSNLLDRLSRCSNVLDSAPLRIQDLDESYKNKLTDWRERAKYSIVVAGIGIGGILFGSGKSTGGENVIGDYSAGGGGYAVGGGGKGFSGGGGSAGGRDDSSLITEDDMVKDIYSFAKERYENLSEKDKKLVKELLKKAGMDKYAEITDDILSGEISWDTLESALKEAGADSETIDIIIKSCETVTEPEGIMKDLAYGQKYYMESSIEAFSEGRISDGLSDLSKSAACGISEITYGIVEIPTEIIADGIDKFSSSFSSKLDKVGEFVGGKTGWFICDIADTVESGTEMISGFLRKLF